MKIGYTSREVCTVTDITYRQLAYWDKINLVKPSIIGARGTGSRRIYSFIDLVCLRVTAKLKEEGISPQKIRKSVAYLAKHFSEQDKLLTDFVFLTDGDRIFILTKDPTMVLDTLHGSQFILSIFIGRIIQDTENKVLRLEREEEAHGHIFEVIIEEDGDRYHAYCPALRGCRTWGHTKAEAFQYVQEAVELYLEALIEDGEPIPGVGLAKNVEEIKPIIKVKETGEKAIA